MMTAIGEEVGRLLDVLGVDRTIWTDGSMPALTPLTGEQIGMVRVVDAADVDAALDRAVAAFRAWRGVPAPRRGELVRLFGEELRAAKDDLAALVILDLDGCRVINPDLPADNLAAAASDPKIRQAFRERLAKFASSATGSSTRIARAVLLDTPLSIDRGEVTDKGSVNQRAVLDHRAGTIEEIYAASPSDKVIIISG